MPAVQLRFPSSFRPSNTTSGVVPIDRVRIVVRNPNARIALDTVVRFGSADSLALPLNVPLDVWWPDESEPFALSLAFVNPTGDTLFRGGPVTLRVAAGSNAQAAAVSVPVDYIGPGADAADLRISPRSLVVLSGDEFSFSGVALSGAGGAIPGAPIAWTTLDPTQAEIQAAAVGVGMAIGAAGTARIVGQLLTGPADTVTLVIQPRPPTLQLSSGGGQVAAPGERLTEPVVVRVVGSDGNGRSGIQVSFAPTHGGSVAPSAATTDADGIARTIWTLGNPAGPQELKVLAPGTTGSPVTVAATAKVPDAPSPEPKPDTAQAPNPGPPAPPRVATRLEFKGTPAGGVVGLTLPAVRVAALDDSGNVAEDYKNPVSLTLLGEKGNTLQGNRNVSAVGGTADFAGLVISSIGSAFRLVATSGNLRPDTSAAFAIVAGAATKIVIESGDAQTGAVSSPLASPLTAKVTDAFGNPVGLVSVKFAVASGGGSISLVTAQTSPTGLAATTWTLGPSPGPQSVTATADGLQGSPLTWTATATAGSALARLAFIQPPSNTVAGRKMTPPVIVQALRANGTNDPTFRGEVTLTLSLNPGGATLQGGSASIGAGAVAFNDLTIDRAGKSYQMVASAPGAESATSPLFDVGSAQPSALTIVGGDGQDGIVSTELAAPLAVRVTDDLGNPVEGVTVSWNVDAGALSAAATATNTLGVAEVRWTLGDSPGRQTAQASVAGLAGSPVAFRAQAKKK